MCVFVCVCVCRVGEQRPFREQGLSVSLSICLFESVLTGDEVTDAWIGPWDLVCQAGCETHWMNRSAQTQTCFYDAYDTQGACDTKGSSTLYGCGCVRPAVLCSRVAIGFIDNTSLRQNPFIIGDGDANFTTLKRNWGSRPFCAHAKTGRENFVQGLPGPLGYSPLDQKLKTALHNVTHPSIVRTFGFCSPQCPS